MTRVLAYCLEYVDGIGFSNGLAGPDEPALAVRDLTGGMRVWIDIGAPDAPRMHKASKAAGRVVVYTHKDPGMVLRQWSPASGFTGRPSWSSTAWTRPSWPGWSPGCSAAWPSRSR